MESQKPSSGGCGVTSEDMPAERKAYVVEKLNPVVEGFERYYLEHFPEDPLVAMSQFNADLLGGSGDWQAAEHIRQEIEQNPEMNRYIADFVTPLLDEFVETCLMSCPPDPIAAMKRFAAEKAAKTCPFHGCRSGLPPECVGDPKKYYVEMDYIFELLEQRIIVLISGEWLLQRSRATPFEPLPCFQDLPPEAHVDISLLRAMVARYPSEVFIVAISHCWLSSHHPDPDGKLLAELSSAIEPYLYRFQNTVDYDDDDNYCEGLYQMFSGAFFFAWCSLFQPYHAKSSNGQYYCLESSQLTEEQQGTHRKALENMDIWYTHQQTEVWMLTKYFDGQGFPYEQRGWPTWEKAVAGLLSRDSCVLDLGLLDLDPWELPLDKIYWIDEIRGTCKVSRMPPCHPEDFEELLTRKHFTCGHADRALIVQNYKRNFNHAAACMKAGAFSSMGWNKHFRVLGLCGGLEDLILAENGIDDAGSYELGLALQHLSNMEMLDVSGNHIGDAGAYAIAKCLQNCSKLQFLNCDSNQMHGGGWLCEVAKHCCNLQSLSLQKNSFNDIGVNELAHCLPHCCELQLLKLSRTCIGDVAASMLAGGLQHCSSLEVLWLDDNQISDVGATAFADCFRYCQKLESVHLGGNCIGGAGASALVGHRDNFETWCLHLGRNNISDAEAGKLADSLQQCGNFSAVDLHFHSNYIGDAGACALAKSLPYCSKITGLDLSQTKASSEWLVLHDMISDVGACALGEGVQHCSCLKLFALSYNSIGDAGACALAAGLQHCSNLKYLALEGNMIGDEGACALASCLQHCSSLVTLELNDNNFSDVGADALKSALNIDWTFANW